MQYRKAFFFFFFISFLFQISLFMSWYNSRMHDTDQFLSKLFGFFSQYSACKRCSADWRLFIHETVKTHSHLSHHCPSISITKGEKNQPPEASNFMFIFIHDNGQPRKLFHIFSPSDFWSFFSVKCDAND